MPIHYQNIFLKDSSNELPVLFKGDHGSSEFSERDILYKVLFDMKKDVNDLKKAVFNIMGSSDISEDAKNENSQMLSKVYENDFENSYKQN